ncbi:DsbA family protein [Kiloniella antarctica]|uniref:DsbA family protein n=1 Tax=Kiloniella antarctica TaxID=1550907 RepID=A0ABW5BJY6_9PROT
MFPKLNFKNTSLVSVGIIATMLSGSPLLAQEKSLEEQNAFDEAVREYLLKNPEIIIESLTRYQELQASREQELKHLAVADNLEELHNAPDSPVLGNPDGDVVLVEFFDYRCPYCHKASKLIQKLIDEDPNLKVVMKEFPILSPESTIAARAALAANEQGKYAEYHFALMDSAQDLSQNRLRALADELDMDIDQFSTDMKSPEIGAAILRTRQLAQRIGASGTPAFVVGDQSVSPGTSYETFKQLIADIRNNKQS